MGKENKELTPEQQIAALEDKVSKLEADIAERDAKIESLDDTVEHLNKAIGEKATEVTNLTVENSELKTQLETAKSEIEAKDGFIEELNEAVEAADSEKLALSPVPTFKVGKDHYKLVVAKSKARFNGQQVEVTAKSLKETEGLLEHCVEKKFGILEKVEKVEKEAN